MAPEARRQLFVGIAISICIQVTPDTTKIVKSVDKFEATRTVALSTLVLLPSTSTAPV